MGDLFEDKRSELVAKSRQSQKERDGKNRYEKRIKSRIANSTKQYNKINMNQLFKDNILTVNIDVKGETNDYIVSISFGGFLDKVQEQLKHNNDILDLKIILRALIDSFNEDNVYIHCSCSDWKYRMAYWATINDINAGDRENRPSDITNPSNSLGPGCKHVMLVLANHSWLIKVASVINNYIKYFEKYKQREYADIIYPAIYGKKYEEPVQLDIFDNGSDELDTKTNTIDAANELGAKSGQFKKGNTQGVRFTSKSNKDNDIQLDIDNSEENDNE